jgi:hypothetical protein
MKNAAAAGGRVRLLDSRMSATTRIQATKYIRRMAGGSQSHLLRCSDGQDYVVKFQNNPQGSRTLANDLLGTLLAKYLGLPVTDVAIVDVGEELIRSTRRLRIKYSRRSEPCQAGLCFGSRYLRSRASGNRETSTISPGTHSQFYLQELVNVKDFAGMLVFDRWTSNTDARQVIFTRGEHHRPDRVVMIDLGFCFHACHWNFPDYRLLGVVGERAVYDSIEGIDAFDPWLGRLETGLDVDVIRKLAAEIPPEWYDFDGAALKLLIKALNQRRECVRDLLANACSLTQHSFRNWIVANHGTHISLPSMNPYMPIGMSA